MIRFGPAGNCKLFYEQGYKQSLEAPAWIKNRGLNAYEYPFTRGINISETLASSIGEEGLKNDVAISVHAPYYINFSGVNEELLEKSYGYVLQSLKYLKFLKGNRCVFHPGTCGKLPREQAFMLLKQRIVELVKRVKDAGYTDMYLCPETMGKHGQLGTYKEIAEICKIDECLIPTIDFGHVNSFEQGMLKTKDDFKKIIDYFIQKIGYERTKIIHVHFSKIEYGEKGEIRHLTFEDEIYGPEFEPFAQVIKEYKLEPVIICESKDVQAEDANIMKDIYEKFSNKN